ncbi:MAG TPA: hypothetical protein VMY78_12615 [Solirubrobacteraceae bacterium]|nr:hypothetical protein [Solirubrobacteraceae bacterium]
MLADLGDRGGDELGVRRREHRIPVVGAQDPLAADVVAGRQPGAHDAVAHLDAQRATRDELEELEHPVVVRHRGRDDLAHGVDAAAGEPLQRGHARVEALEAAMDRAIGVGQDPRRRPLEDVRPLGSRPDPRTDLDRGRARPDERHALPGEVVLVIPVRGRR